MTRSSYLFPYFLSLLLVLGGGCDSVEPPAPPVLAKDALSNATYNFVGLDQSESVVLLGKLDFSEREEGALSGSWELTPWGEQEHFTSLPGTGSFTGLIHGDVAVIQISLSEIGESLGLVVEGLHEDRLVGSLTLLPDSRFEGRFEAIARR